MLGGEVLAGALPMAAAAFLIVTCANETAKSRGWAAAWGMRAC
jgi:hypothetical protein